VAETPVAAEMPSDPTLGSSRNADEQRWAQLHDHLDRQRYLKPLSGRIVGGTGQARSDVAVARSAHPMLGSPASVTRTGSNLPDQRDVRDYLRHSADLTMRAGTAAGLVYPLAVCALAEHYIFRRIAGSSSAAMAAAATAAAELGRGAPEVHPPTPRVRPGFGGLAELIGWLAGEPTADDSDTGRDHEDRLARLLQPSAQTRSLYRLLVTAARTPVIGIAANAVQLLLAATAVLTRSAKTLLALFWVGLAIGWFGLTSALVNGTRAGAVTSWVTVGASMLLLITFAVTGLAVTVLVNLMSVTGRIRAADRQRYGLLPGAQSLAPSGFWSRWLDRRVGVAPIAGTPPLFSWLSDRLDDLAGQDDGVALTFGDLWCGAVGEHSAEQRELVRQAALDPELRVINLVLLTCDLSGRRPYRLPFLPADEAEKIHGARLLFCETCLDGLLPERIITQLVKAAPSTDTDHSCPRHSNGVLRELPDPWDLPVVFAVRLSFSPPGLFQAVPLYSIGERDSALVQTHWFADGSLAGTVSTDFFDVLLPRWPTFGINVEDADDDLNTNGVRLPAQDAARARRRWSPLESTSALLGAVVDSSLGGRDGSQSDLPGFRGRIALIRRASAERGWLLPPTQDTVLNLALRGLQAGRILRERFTGSDDQVPGQTQTDRHRWIRMRMALRSYQEMSLDIGARLPLYRDLASSYHVPQALTGWFTPALPAAERDPIWADAASAIVTLRAMSAGGVLDFDATIGAPPTDPG
jgi:hypothetical protein